MTRTLWPNGDISMKRRLFLLVAASVLSTAVQFPALSQGNASTAPTQAEIQRWERMAQSVDIIRDDWGIAHVYGATDAAVVFGTIYAQAEDDFNRVENNYLTQLGMLSLAEGPGRIFNDLRAKIFADPAVLKREYESSPADLKTLMNAWADGLNFYLYKNPSVKPRALARFEPWMTLSFTEGSIGGDISGVNIQQLQAFYGQPGGTQIGDDYIVDPEPVEPGGSNGIAVAPSNTTNKRALLLINPHTSHYFRSELQMVSEEGLNAYGAVTWGQFFIYQGFNTGAGWMHTTASVDAVDEYAETIIKRGDKNFYNRAAGDHSVQEPRWHDRLAHVHDVSDAPRADRARTRRQMDRGQDDGRPREGAHAVVHAHEGDRLRPVPQDDGAAYQHVEQHDLRGREGQHRLPQRQLRSQA
jgi:acyl-homoserine-lactone acylase